MAAFDVPVPAGTTQSTPPAGTTQSTPPTDPYAGMSPVQSIQQINQQQGVYGAENAGQEKSPDYWTGLAARARTLPSKLAAGGYEAANTMLYGIPDVVVKAASSDAYKKLQDLRAANPGATLLGAGARSADAMPGRRECPPGSRPANGARRRRDAARFPAQTRPA